ncbi:MULTISPECIES: YqgE/AlgH family protein [unclassified Photobacterium]|uniref:YqgE/AlgH family protein n=1 Tax=unclassified Photobacterium TaxID=2628852 RepID=UPI000D179EAB|nr:MULTISPECIES: YqgE/AlgH family protein [unclassified Photobacterium]PSV26569.1 YqgE/AlgH family protein [Photobacterium sp. GB-56]PSV31770.1 YqgE/AlgH family protein [Photobacterium sp. GB-72]PSV37467.1 YqgE/AlgH family protein [Photobacterium sp. GB-27]PSV39123.1 YqgE/AlgH family protein [Photobacterium sp. GB-210]PSV45406.1 YqgE/AlgH family protein [Photobacterium sp. GB-36]
MNLTNHFLVAMPTMQDPQFKQSVIYLCEHNNEGAMGIIINQPIDISIADMLEQIEVERKLPVADPISLESLVLNGGPVSEDRGFVLHTTKGEYSSSLPVNNELAVTTSLDILSELGTAQAPNQFLVALGYAGWDAGQLEQELVDNNWLTIEADDTIIFSTPIDERWHKAIEKLGFTPANLSLDIGHA